ncbi:hypothetical protein U0035_11900 [Niabella yanshanensis]|uniref:Transglutaminase-like domain-containing protein n=1 Tax=Niabella yanshanensis TaxID=577386 RepID=A0ABZ0VZB1_9BACT|nr:hypothetical protein [Niabella yanshanensis]WQD36368.1 hypothetical protein U0035_11900 [Niabella yanshanensis]
MKHLLIILSFALLPFCLWAGERNVSFDFYGDRLSFVFNDRQFVNFNEKGFTDASIQEFYDQSLRADYNNVFTMLANYRQNQKADDWLFYQLVRKTAEQISPKAENYLRYTLYKWYFMVHSGYGTMLSQNNGRLLFYIQCDENIYNIPYRLKGGKQYVCLNYHDYGSNIDFDKEPFHPVALNLPAYTRIFSYKIARLPNFSESDYVDKKLQFTYNASEYNFKIKINPQIKNLFNNYPAVEYKDFINIPVSNATYQSLIQLIKKQLRGLNTKAGIDYIMHFTRYAFAFDADTQSYGSEKRLSPEQTLLSPYSDCEDRVGLFFFLVKEIYNLPMIVLAYPKHVTIAVKFDKPVGNTIEYNGAKYSVCEPTPQRMELRIGELLPELKNAHFKVAYAYSPN